MALVLFAFLHQTYHDDLFMMASSFFHPSLFFYIRKHVIDFHVY